MRHFAVFLNLVVAQALRNDWRWEEEGWREAYYCDLRLAISGVCCWEKEYGEPCFCDKK